MWEDLRRAWRRMADAIHERFGPASAELPDGDPEHVGAEDTIGRARRINAEIARDRWNRLEP